jgi:3,4-dihydroxy 2-butanone 4-phosphate synthase/GTP cyclohydrolase II
MAAEMVTPRAINFMAKYGRGLICLSLTPDRCDQLALPMMVSENRSGFGTAFTVSIEAATGVTTGISAADRARTVRVAVSPNARPEDVVRPGHVFPLRARAGGVLVRTGQTEGSVDLARLAGLEPAGVICEIMNEDGTMSRLPELEVFSTEHGIPIISVADLIRYRLHAESMVQPVSETEIEIDGIGTFRAVVYRTDVDELEHLALIKGQPVEDEPVLGRVHREHVLGDVFRSGAQDTRWRIEYALRQIEAAGCGILVYLQKAAPQLENELRALTGEAPKRQDTEPGEIGLPPDLREFGIGAQILLHQGARRLRLITSNTSRIKGIEGYGIEVVEHLSIPARPPKGTQTSKKEG